MDVIKRIIMELKRINVLVPEDAHEVLDKYQKKHAYRSRDKALAELLLEFKILKSDL